MFLFNLLANVKDNVIKSLDIMWQGVLAIFVVIAVIIIVMYAVKWIINYFNSKKNNKT